MNLSTIMLPKNCKNSWNCSDDNENNFLSKNSVKQLPQQQIYQKLQKKKQYIFFNRRVARNSQ